MLKFARDALRHAPFVYKVVRGVWTPPPSVFEHLYFNGVFTVRLPFPKGASFKMEHRGHQVENDLFWRGFGKGWEGRSLMAWAERCKSASVIIDVGANTGVFALAAKAINPSAKVIAVEPVARVAEQLRHNIRLNGFDIEVHELALSDTNGTATFYDFPGDHEYSASLDSRMGGTVETTIPVRRLDDLVDSANLIKVDVELHEPAVLRGAKRLLQSKPVLLLEVLNSEAERSIHAELGDEWDWEMIEEDRNAIVTPIEG
jgi:FkbM family methyltransferase